jgi:hypothetical protein
MTFRDGAQLLTGDVFSWFAGEILGNMLEVEPRKWRRPKKVDYGLNRVRVQRFRAAYDKFDWTGQLR